MDYAKRPTRPASVMSVSIWDYLSQNTVVNNGNGIACVISVFVHCPQNSRYGMKYAGSKGRENMDEWFTGQLG